MCMSWFRNTRTPAGRGEDGSKMAMSISIDIYIDISRYIPKLIQLPTKICPTEKQELNDSLSLKWYKNCTKCKAKLNLIIKSLE